MADPDALLDTPLIGEDSTTQTTQALNGVSETETPPKDGDAAQVDTTTDKGDEAEVDYKARFEAVEKELAKVNLDRKAENTGRQRTADRDAARDAKLDALVDTVSAMQDSQTVLIKALNSGETDGLSAELDTIAQDSRTRTSSSRIRLQAQGLLEALTDIGKDADGNTVVDIQKDERFADVRGDWNRISGDANLEPSEVLAQLSRVVTQANVTMRGIDRELHQKALDDAKNVGTVERKKVLEEAGVLDTYTDGRMGSSEGSVLPLLQRYGRGERVTRAEQTQIDEHLDDQLDDTPGSVFDAR